MVCWIAGAGPSTGDDDDAPVEVVLLGVNSVPARKRFCLFLTSWAGPGAEGRSGLGAPQACCSPTCSCPSVMRGRTDIARDTLLGPRTTGVGVVALREDPSSTRVGSCAAEVDRVLTRLFVTSFLGATRHDSNGLPCGSGAGAAGVGAPAVPRIFVVVEVLGPLGVNICALRVLVTDGGRGV